MKIVISSEENVCFLVLLKGNFLLLDTYAGAMKWWLVPLILSDLGEEKVKALFREVWKDSLEMQMEASDFQNCSE